MLTLEQAITQYGQCENFCKYQGLIVSLEELNQITAWLRELQERRKEPEVIKCGECEHSRVRGCELYCTKWVRYTSHKGYCHRGAERKTE